MKPERFLLYVRQRGHITFIYMYIFNICTNFNPDCDVKTMSLDNCQSSYIFLLLIFIITHNEIYTDRY